MGKDHGFLVLLGACDDFQCSTQDDCRLGFYSKLEICIEKKICVQIKKREVLQKILLKKSKENLTGAGRYHQPSLLRSRIKWKLKLR